MSQFEHKVINTPRFRRTAASLTLLVVCVVASACSSKQRRHSEAFWRQATGDATIRVRPARDIGAPGVTSQDEFRGVVIRHDRASGSAIDHILELKRAGGDIVKVYYRIGAKRALPLATGEHVIVLLMQRRHLDDDGVDVGLMAWRLNATINEKDAQAPSSTESKELVAVVEVREVLDPKTVPSLLKSLRATDITAYHESGTYVGDCEEVRAHRHFRIMRPKWVVTPADKPLQSRLLAPGSSVLLDDGSDRFEVLLLDNRKTEVSTCISQPEPTWSWAAIRVKKVQEQVATQIEDPATKRGNISPKPAGTTATR